jgi:hypothetical protein
MRYLKHLITFTLIGIANFSFAQTEEELILIPVNDFLEGGTNGDVARFKNAFVSDAVQKSVGKNGVSGTSVEALASKIKPGTKMERTTKVVSWSYAGTCATAITETEYPANKIIDVLNLLKIGNDWKIVSRVFSRIEKEEVVISSAKASAPASSKASPAKAATAPAKKKPVPVNDGW